jgi:hypothetical protein
VKKYDMGEYSVIYLKGVDGEKLTFYLLKRKTAKAEIRRVKKEMFRIYGPGKIRRRPKYFGRGLR